MQGAEQRIREAGLRVTRPRAAVLGVLDEAREPGRPDGGQDGGQGGGHLLVAEVVAQVKQRLGHVSTQAVYDCLEALTRAGVVRRVELPGSPSRYESRVGDNHHHLTCRSCGVVVDVDCGTTGAPCLQPSDSHGFDLEEAEVVFWGLCPRCSPVRAGGWDPR